MKKIILFIPLFLISSFCLGQNINKDTTITHVMNLMESFELRFEHSPGQGITWYFPESNDTTKVTIHQIKHELMEGYGPKGGKYIATYQYTGRAKGTYNLNYVYGRPWLKEVIYRCRLTIIVN